MSERIVLTTCKAWPELSAGDADLHRVLTDRGYVVSVEPWNDAPLARFTAADLVILRSNWDFHHHLADFERWIDAVDESPARLINDAVLVRAHNHKSYLLRLAEKGIPTPRTLVLRSFDQATVRDWMERNDLDRIVIKPAWGASGHDVQMASVNDLAQISDWWRGHNDQRELLVQEFMPGIRNGETALVYFDGRFSHALLRTPASDDFRVNSAYGGSSTSAGDVPDSMVTFGAGVLETLPVRPTYVRVDVVGTDDGYAVMELELNEPGLGLHLAPGSAERFADAILSG